MTPTEKKLRVLIADDVQETRRSTRLMLSTLDHVEVVAIAPNGKQAVEMAHQHHPDIVVLDINMPEMDGLTAYKHIVAEHPDTGCIIISAESDQATLDKAAKLGIEEYLIKPFIIDELESSINHLAERLNDARKKIIQTYAEKSKDIAKLEEMAHQYLKDGRTDDEATRIFESLAKNPQCNMRWLESLAMMYAIRQEWGKLKFLSARLERETENKK